jgi:hypothetical protein
VLTHKVGQLILADRAHGPHLGAELRQVDACPGSRPRYGESYLLQKSEVLARWNGGYRPAERVHDVDTEAYNLPHTRDLLGIRLRQVHTCLVQHYTAQCNLISLLIGSLLSELFAYFCAFQWRQLSSIN